MACSLAAACGETRRAAMPTSNGLTSEVQASPATETPAARQFAAWLEAFNSGDRDKLLAYHQQHFPYEVATRDVSDIDREHGLSKHTGGFALKKPDHVSAVSIAVILKERRSDQFARAEMEVDAVAPHRIVRFAIRPIETPEEFLSAEDLKALTIDDTRRRALIEGIAKALKAHYVFPDRAEQMISVLRGHLAAGDYDKITHAPAFAGAITKDLRDVSHDLHLYLHVERPPSRPEPTPMNFGFGPIERLEGNVAHLVIDGFPPADDDQAREAIGRLMSQVADADALIIDLRSNGGGSPDTVALVASYVFDEPTHINDMYSRDLDSTREYWTLRDVRGTRFGGKKPVYVLTSKRTFSGGEELAYDLQCLRRATIIGETTAGGAHPVAPHVLDELFTIMVPWGRPINPITKTNWEGVGVVPDIQAAADLALDEAHRRAREDIAKGTGR
jgi:hypothetical protein